MDYWVTEDGQAWLLIISWISTLVGGIGGCWLAANMSLVSGYWRRLTKFVRIKNHERA